MRTSAYKLGSLLLSDEEQRRALLKVDELRSDIRLHATSIDKASAGVQRSIDRAGSTSSVAFGFLGFTVLLSLGLSMRGGR
jgi:uncharacterized protein (DUF3084 family)